MYVVALALPLNAYPPLSFVGNNYYCESASWYNVDGIYFFNNTLWDGAGCVDRCDDTIRPWFYRQLKQTTQDDIEA